MSVAGASPQSLLGPLDRIGPLRRLDRWLHAMPHPGLVVEIASSHVAAARWGNSRGNLESFGVEPLDIGSIMASPLEANVARGDAVRSALQRVFARVPHHGSPVALLIPDPVVRVFILPFENLPRRPDEALPLLRWRLKKSVPFEMDETAVSWARQGGRDGKLEIVAAVARQQIIREYEEVVEASSASVGVILSSSLASLALLEERGATLLIRMSGRTLTTVIVNGSNLTLYRSSEMPAEAPRLDPRAMLDEIFPAVAYFQDTWGGMVDRARLAGFNERESEFRNAISGELRIPAGSLAEVPEVAHLSSNAMGLFQQGLDPLVGWMMNVGA
jgi:type IV pilus assembly protein PilM